MTILRSLIFTVLFYSSNAIMCVGIFWLPLVPHRAALFTIERYMRYYGWLERTVLGLRYEMIGREHLPAGGCYIAAIKHQSVWETYKLHEWFTDPATIMKEELKHLPLWGWYAQKMRAIFVARGTHRAMKSLVAGGLRAKSEGQMIVIFPQGTRVPCGAKKPYKRGVMELYTALGVPLVPIALNSGKFWPRHSFIKKSGIITVQVLPPISPGLSPDVALQQLTDAIETVSDKL